MDLTCTERLWRIVKAEVRCNCYCMWQIVRHLNPVCELRAYDQNGDITMIATTKDSIWKAMSEGRKISIDRIFYGED